MRTDATTPLEKELLDALAHLLCNVEEDCPSEYRSKHLRICMRDVREALEIT